MILSELVKIVKEAIENCRENGYGMPHDDLAIAAELIEHGVFGPANDCLDGNGDVLDIYVQAVTEARKS